MFKITFILVNEMIFFFFFILKNCRTYAVFSGYMYIYIYNYKIVCICYSFIEKVIFSLFSFYFHKILYNFRKKCTRFVFIYFRVIWHFDIFVQMVWEIIDTEDEAFLWKVFFSTKISIFPALGCVESFRSAVVYSWSQNFEK